jgi:flagellar M-ring protein FliF
LAGLSENLKQAWRQTNLVQRVILLTVLLACAGAGVMLLGWARKPHMGMLYQGLEPQEASAIVEKIRDADIQYELASGGTTIRVPVEEIYSLRLTMAATGLPAGGQKGYRILDEAEFGSSPDKLRINYVRAVEGELAQTIQMLDSVVSARVHVVVPEGRLFNRKKKGASATVALRLKPGWRMSPAKAAAVVHMVAGAVEDLTPDNVVVVADGEMISSEEKGPMGGGSGSFFDYKTRVEEVSARKVQTMLDAALGPNRSSVSVAAEIATLNSRETTETYDPDGKVITKEEIKSTSTTPGDKAGGSTREEETTSEYMVSRTTKEVTDLPGKIQSLSVAILVDLTPPEAPATPEGEEGAPGPSGAALTIKDVEDMARSALGLSETDLLSVKETRFNGVAASNIPLPEASGGWTDPAFLLEMGRRFSLGILVIGALLALRMFRGPKKTADTAEIGNQPQLAGAGVGADHLLPGADADPEVLRSQITNALQNNPDEVKKLFLHWIESKQEAV